MPRTTKLGSCEKCGVNTAHFGVVTSFYALGSILKRPLGKPAKQVKGSLRTYGLCLGCFMSFAQSMGMDATKAKELRLQLRPPSKARTQSRK
jgi:hypothetical protein